MADKGGNNRSKARAAAELPRAPLAGSSFDALVTALGGGMLDFQSMLAIADILPVLTAYVDREFVYRFVNKPYAEWLEIPRKQILGRSMEQVLGSDLFALRRPMLDAAMAGERKFFVADFEHPTRGPLALQIDYVPWADATGDVRGVIIVLQDMTEHRAAERALKESEARFRQLANSAPAMMWVTRLDGKRDFVNDAYAEFSGLTREEAQTADWTEALHPDDRERVLSGGGALLEQGKPISFEARFRRHDGEWRWLRSVSQPRYGTDGEIVGYIGVASDITLAKEAELELRRQVEERTRDLALSEARFRAVFDTVLEVLVLMEPDGTVVELNRKQTSWRPEIPRELIGRKVWEGPTFQLFPDYVPLMKKAVKTAAKGKVFEQEVRLEREGVPNAHLDVSVQPVRDGDGNIIYLLFEARDITELKAAQEQLRQSQKMEALGQLTGGIAHDFNNLLTVIVGGLDIIARRADDAKLKRYAENALGAAERGARLTGQLLAFSRVQRLEVRPTYVAPLIENMRPLLRNVLGPGISKTFDLDTAMIPVMADPTQLEVAVLNLAINARDAMPGGGVLSFSSRALHVEDDPDLMDGDYIELTIADTGTGMAPEVVERAFEPFFTTKEVGKGTGLGLSMVYGMARQSGGTARIRSTPGEGTAVSLLFRKADHAAAEVAHREDEPVAAGTDEPFSILVIDDDPDIRGFIVAALEEQGYDVRDASDGRKGLAALERKKADLVVLDFIMPGLSGAEVAQRIRERTPEQPILFVSGYSETEAVKRTAPDTPLLAKPFRADALTKAVRSALTPAS